MAQIGAVAPKKKKNIKKNKTMCNIAVCIGRSVNEFVE
jgi:hypothetical protein